MMDGGQAPALMMLDLSAAFDAIYHEAVTYRKDLAGVESVAEA